MSLIVVHFLYRQEGGQLAVDGFLLPDPLSDGCLPGHRVVRSPTDGEPQTYATGSDSLSL